MSSSAIKDYAGIAWWSWDRCLKDAEMSLDRMNEEVRASLRTYAEYAPQAEERHEFALRFWMRLIRNSGSVVALAAAGMGSQAAIVHRVSLEHFAIMYALAKGTWTDEQVLEMSKFEGYKYALALRETLKKDDGEGRVVLTSGAREALLAFIDDDENKADPTGVNIHNILCGEDLKFFHDTYRQLSLHAAHANAVSVTWEPSPKEMAVMLVGVKELLDLSALVWRDTIGIKHSQG